ncbi:MAG: TolC family protein, partial [Bacteriovoracaceae bacterium]
TKSKEDYSAWQLALNFPIYKRTIQNQFVTAIHEKRLYKNKYEAVTKQFNYQFANSLGEYLYQKYKTAVITNSIQLAETNLNEVTLSFQLKKKNKIDLLNAQAYLTSLESKKVLCEQEEKEKFQNFLEFSGLSEEEFKSTQFAKISLVPAEIEKLITSIFNLHELIPKFHNIDKESKNIANSPLYLTKLSEKDYEVANLKQLTSNEWPEISFQASLSNQDDNLKKAFDRDKHEQRYALIFTIPLFNFGSGVSSTLDQVKSTNATIKQKELEINQIQNGINNDANRIEALYAALKSQEINVNQQNEIWTLNTESYHLGRANMLDLLKAQDDFYNSKLNKFKMVIELSTLIEKFMWEVGEN